MKINGSPPMAPVQNKSKNASGGNSSEVSRLQGQIQNTRKEIAQLSKSENLSGTEEAKKKKLEQQLAELQKQLQNAKAEDAKKQSEEETVESSAADPLKEAGHGDMIDVLL